MSNYANSCELKQVAEIWRDLRIRIVQSQVEKFEVVLRHNLKTIEELDIKQKIWYIYMYYITSYSIIMINNESITTSPYFCNFWQTILQLWNELSQIEVIAPSMRPLESHLCLRPERGILTLVYQWSMAQSAFSMDLRSPSPCPKPTLDRIIGYP